MGLSEDLSVGPTALDTSAVIYFIEQEPRFVGLLRPLFIEADRGARTLVTSTMTLHEVLIVPFRTGNRVLAERYEQLLTRSRGVKLIDLTRDVLRAAAQLRAASGVKAPDAMQLAAALAGGCSNFVTNDRRLPTVAGLRVVQLSDYV